MNRNARSLRILSWALLVAGVVGAIMLWATAREAVETTRRIYGHATVTFQDLETRISVTKVALGFASLLVGAFLWTLGRTVADLVSPRPVSTAEAVGDR